MTEADVDGLEVVSEEGRDKSEKTDERRVRIRKAM